LDQCGSSDSRPDSGAKAAGELSTLHQRRARVKTVGFFYGGWERPTAHEKARATKKAEAAEYLQIVKGRLLGRHLDVPAFLGTLSKEIRGLYMKSELSRTELLPPVILRRQKPRDVVRELGVCVKVLEIEPSRVNPVNFAEIPLLAKHEKKGDKRRVQIGIALHVSDALKHSGESNL
jgi:hypothetical protein